MATLLHALTQSSAGRTKKDAMEQAGGASRKGLDMRRKGLPEGFTERLNEAMAKAGTNKKELALKTGYNRKSIYAWCSGDFAPNALAIARICKALHVSADYLILGGKN